MTSQDEDDKERIITGRLAVIDQNEAVTGALAGTLCQCSAYSNWGLMRPSGGEFEIF
jgi:aerobic-type carbon monoxide dehydrogenase small subunit (CoxS/CutS family)